MIATMPSAATVHSMQTQVFTPEFHGSIAFEVQNDWAFDSDDSTTEVNTFSTTIEPYLIFPNNNLLRFLRRKIEVKNTCESIIRLAQTLRYLFASLLENHRT